MTKLIVELKITLSQPEYTPKVFASVETWLKTYIMTELPPDVQATYKWSNDESIVVNVHIEWTKAELVEKDFSDMEDWIATQIIANLPSNAHGSYTWAVTS